MYDDGLTTEEWWKRLDREERGAVLDKAKVSFLFGKDIMERDYWSFGCYERGQIRAVHRKVNRSIDADQGLRDERVTNILFTGDAA